MMTMRAADDAAQAAMLTAFAPAKINLSLRVVGRRPDGYHLLDSLVVFADIGDRIEATPADDLRLRIIGPMAGGLRAADDNLVLRAARALRDRAGVRRGAQLTLDKHLPVSSGIGGGSADAAATLRLLHRLWAVPDDIDLMALTADLGADVPVCLAGLPARLQGIGERLTTVPALPMGWLLLVNPGIGVSTPDVFRARSAQFSPKALFPDGWRDLSTLADWLHGEPNDLETPACVLCPDISRVLARLRQQPRCLLARMSGSGATCFGLFESQSAADAAAQDVRQEGWWVAVAAIRSTPNEL